MGIRKEGDGHRHLGGMAKGVVAVEGGIGTGLVSLWISSRELEMGGVGVETSEREKERRVKTGIGAVIAGGRSSVSSLSASKLTFYEKQSSFVTWYIVPIGSFVRSQVETSEVISFIIVYSFVMKAVFFCNIIYRSNRVFCQIMFLYRYIIHIL